MLWDWERVHAFWPDDQVRAFVQRVSTETKLHVELRLAVRAAVLLKDANVGLDECQAHGRCLLHRRADLVHTPEAIAALEEEQTH